MSAPHALGRGSCRSCRAYRATERVLSACRAVSLYGSLALLPLAIALAIMGTWFPIVVTLVILSDEARTRSREGRA